MSDRLSTSSLWPIVSARAAAASSLSRAMIRPGWRRSSDRTSLSRMRGARCELNEAASAAAGIRLRADGCRARSSSSGSSAGARRERRPGSCRAARRRLRAARHIRRAFSLAPAPDDMRQMDEALVAHGRRAAFRRRRRRRPRRPSARARRAGAPRSRSAAGRDRAWRRSPP